jgi:hypothetical protein
MTAGVRCSGKQRGVTAAMMDAVLMGVLMKRGRVRGERGRGFLVFSEKKTAMRLLSCRQI